MRRLLVVLLLGTAALTAGCGSSNDTSPGGSESSGSSGDVKVIDVTIQGDTITPNGERVPVALGQEVELDIHADADGELHVHSDPEQHVEYHPGTTQQSLGSFSIPGQIAVESHALGKTVVVLQVQ